MSRYRGVSEKKKHSESLPKTTLEEVVVVAVSSEDFDVRSLTMSGIPTKWTVSVEKTHLQQWKTPGEKVLS